MILLVTNDCLASDLSCEDILDKNHTQYTYIYIYMERERERESERADFIENW